jgi:hypothetical protein
VTFNKKHEEVEQADLAQGKAERISAKEPRKEENDVHLHFQQYEKQNISPPETRVIVNRHRRFSQLCAHEHEKRE